MVRQEGRCEDWHQVGLSGMRWFLKRWWFWVGSLGTGLVALFAVGCILIAAEERLNQTNCDKILLGMREEQVFALLDSFHLGYQSIEGTGLAIFRQVSFADEDGNSIEVSFSDGRVTAKHFVPSRLSLFQCMKRRIEVRILGIRP
jgi:hypothetical protein